MAIDSQARDERPLVMHVVHRFDTGGLENGIVNLINHMPPAAYRHAVVALTEVTDFRRRVQAANVEFVSMHKRPGHGVWLYPRLFALMRRLRPAIVHTRNLGTLEAVIPAWLAGVPARLHGEHGRDVGDLDGSNAKNKWMRRFYRPFVSHYVSLSNELTDYLVAGVGAPKGHVSQIFNGVDTAHFRPTVKNAENSPELIAGCPFQPDNHWMLGTVGRMHPVKDQVTLVRAFLRVLELNPSMRDRLRLVLIGDGPLRAQCRLLLDAAGVLDLAWLPGERDDVAEVMRGLHCFVLPSLAEGLSNSILEAMSSGLPVIATHVGGNADLVSHGKTGLLVPSASPDSMAEAIATLAAAPARAAAMGQAGRARVEVRFSIQGMVAAYQALYDRHVAGSRPQLQGA